MANERKSLFLIISKKLTTQLTTQCSPKILWDALNIFCWDRQTGNSFCSIDLICLSLPPPGNVNVKIYMCVVNCEPFWLFKDFNPFIALLNYPGKRRNCLRWKLSWKLITQGEWIRAPIEFISNLEN